MDEWRLILNESDARKARSTIARLQTAQSADSRLNLTLRGFPVEVGEKLRVAAASYERALSRSLADYEHAKSGGFGPLFEAWKHEPGVILIIARLARGYSQQDLARKLGVKEQQIQRYEAERYRQISLANFKRIAGYLGVKLSVAIRAPEEAWFGLLQPASQSASADEQRKVIQHAYKHGWITRSVDAVDESDVLRAFIEEANSSQPSPTLLRTGLNPADLTNDLSLRAWRARVIELARKDQSDLKDVFDCLDVSWLQELVHLSSFPDGPQRARSMLRDKGVQLVVESTIPGLRLDGAALLCEGIPVVALTLRHDRLDNFWFTLLHELGHIFLHFHAGLSAGFFDDVEHREKDEIESEANTFAESLLISPEKWKASPARISLLEEPIEDFARQLNIHPAIVFGRIRRARNNYKIFSDRVGRNEVRKWLIDA